MIQRYKMIFDDYMFEDDDGEWVKYDDHIAEVENKACEWRVVEETAYKIYCETQCEGYHMFLATYHYCPYCGGKIKIKE